MWVQIESEPAQKEDAPEKEPREWRTLIENPSPRRSRSPGDKVAQARQERMVGEAPSGQENVSRPRRFEAGQQWRTSMGQLVSVVSIDHHFGEDYALLRLPSGSTWISGLEVPPHWEWARRSTCFTPFSIVGGPL